MSGPWEDFKASSTEAGPWDEFTPKEQPTEKGMRTERVQQFYKDVGGGALETIGAVGSNMLLAPIAGLAGLSSLPDGLDAAVSTMGKVFDLGYQPKTDVGKAGAENVSNVLNLPAEYGGKLGEAVAGNEGRLVGEIAGEFATDLLPLGALKRGKGKTKAPEAPKLDTIEKRLEAMVKRDPSNPATGPITDTRTGAQLSKEAYDAALREKELQRTSAFNRPDQFPDMVQESPMDRMVRDLGGEPNAPVTPDSVMGRMADDLTTERSTPDQRAAQDLIEQRQAQLEQDMRIRATPELQAAERARQEQAPAVSPEHQKLMDDMEAMQQAQREQEAMRLEQARQAEEAQRQAEAQQAIEARNAALEADVATARAKDEAISDVAHRRMGPEDTTRSGSILDNFKNKPISNRGAINRQRGAIDTKVISDTYDALRRGVATRMDYFRAWKGAFDARAMQEIESDLRDPKSRSTLVLMRPDSFHNLALKRDDMVDAPRLHKNIEQGLESEKGLREIPQLWTDTGPDGVAQVTGHEGRHRMDVFKKMGIEAVPVIIRDGGYRWGGTDPYAGPRPTKIRPEGGLGKGAKVLDFPAKTYHDYIQEAPATVDRTTKPIGQRGFANSQTGATTFFSFGKKDAKELIRDNNSKLNKIEQELNALSKSFWNDQAISSEDFRARQSELLARQLELEQVNRKWQQTLPPQRETEIHPGYKKIPLGAEVLTDRRGSLERATVRENRQSQFGDTTTWYPRVEFSDGQMKRLLPSDIKKVVRDPFKGPGKLQAGAIRLPFGKKPVVDQLKKIEGIKNDPQMRNIFPEKLSVEEVIKEHAALKTPDVDQNGLQRLMNHLTKGSLYQAIKTDNPIVRVVGEKIRQANNYAMEATGRLVHDGLAPLAQKLSKKEKADVWAVQQMAEAKGVELTPEFLREEGFNQKQIDWVTEHKSVMDDMYSRMSDSMRAAGLEPVSARVAYVASRARGDFRRLIMKDNKVVGIMGDNTRMGLNKQIERLKKDHPEYEIGQERYYGGRAAKGTEEGFMQMLDFLSKDNPDFKLFVNHVNDMLSQDAFQYMNAKSHTMQKKRIEGMEGRKMYADAVKNAEEGMQAQIRYAETMIKWSELSKAIAEIKPLLKQDNGLDMPNAKEWANEYIQGALGNSPGKLGDALDSVTAAIGKGTGIGTTIPARTVSAMKSYVNGVLLGFGNVGFLTANALQLPRTMPEMAAWLNTKGIEAGYDLGLGRALISVQKQLFNSKLTDLERGAFEYAKKNHVYSSNLFESGNTVSKGLSYYWQKGTQMIASPLERETRKVAFFAYTHMLDEAGFKPSDGLYEAAQNLTDMHMNNYAQAEAPRVYQETGGIGRSAYNLMSFKHNELSRLAMFAREIPNGQGKPILTAMASQVAFAGLIGTLGFAEADALYEKITAMMGEPTSLTKILLDNPEIPDALKFGMGSLADVDLTNRMGLQLTPGSMIDLVAPGFGKLGDIAGAAGEMVSQPNLYNAANVAREALPLSVGGIMDRTIFETEDGMALNRNKVSASAVRNDADKLWKALGMTGVNESVQKKLSYENQKIDQVYKDKRGKVIDGAIKEYYMRGVMPDNWVERYIELQGDPKEAKAAIQARIEALNVDRPTKELMQNAASKSISSQHKLLRRLGME